VQRLLAIALIAVAAVTGCGADTKQTASETRPSATPLGSECEEAGDAGDGTVYLCYGSSANHGRFVLDRADGPRTLAVPPPSPVGHWAWAEVSPDGETILAQWSAECEVPVAYLLPAIGGRPRAAVPAYSSRAVGWTNDGRAIVKVLESECAPNAPRPGFYLVDPDGGTAGPFKRRPA
jgi:hypothetical protein